MAEIVPAGSRPPMPLTLPDMESIEPVHFDGWSVEDLDGWLTSVLPTFATIRRGIGLALWHLRQRAGDGPYGQFAAAYAKRAGVTAATVGRWRTDAEAYYGLESASKRSKSMRDSALARVADAQSELPPKPQQGSVPVLLAEGDPAPDAVGVVRRERQRPEKPKGHTPAPAEPSTNGGESDPLTPEIQATLARRLLDTDPDDDEWVRCRCCPDRPGFVRKARKVNNGCGHALIRRLGNKCQDCGEVVGPAPFAGRR